LITESFVRHNHLTTYKSNTVIAGITNDESASSRAATVIIKSRFNDFQLRVDANVIQKIPYKVNRETFKEIKSVLPHLDYAESDVGHEDVEILLGVEFVNICLLGEKKFVGKMCLEKSQFG
jgi:hypothetical protein